MGPSIHPWSSVTAKYKSFFLKKRSKTQYEKSQTQTNQSAQRVSFSSCLSKHAPQVHFPQHRLLQELSSPRFRPSHPFPFCTPHGDVCCREKEAPSALCALCPAAPLLSRTQKPALGSQQASRTLSPFVTAERNPVAFWPQELRPGAAVHSEEAQTLTPPAPALQTAAKAQLSSRRAADSAGNGRLPPARRHSHQRGGQAEEPTRALPDSAAACEHWWVRSGVSAALVSHEHSECLPPTGTCKHCCPSFIRFHCEDPNKYCRMTTVQGMYSSLVTTGAV